MRPNATENQLTEIQTWAVELCWLDEQRDEDIARGLGIHRATLWRWKQLPAFQAARAEHLRVARQDLMRRARVSRSPGNPMGVK